MFKRRKGVLVGGWDGVGWGGWQVRKLCSVLNRSREVYSTFKQKMVLHSFLRVAEG